MEDQSQPTRMERAERESQLQPALDYDESVACLRYLLARAHPSLSDQAIRGFVATDRLIKRMRDEFGLLSKSEVLALLGVEQMTAAHMDSLLSFEYGGAQVYPGFQFDRSLGSILHLMFELKSAIPVSTSMLGLACWLCSPSGFLNGERPVDHLSKPLQVVEAAKGHYLAVW
jgi:hypothetical protein